MMQESGGLGLDPMQSSEGAFNTRFPRQPNGITDPAYSIECGVQEIKACLVSAEVETPVDMERIKLALQGYNYGNGYIPWAKEKDGGYTPANANRIFRYDGRKTGMEQLRGQAVCVTCIALLSIWTDSDSEREVRQSCRWHCPKKKWRRDVLELVWI